MGEGTSVEAIVENSRLHSRNFDSSTLDLAYPSLDQMEGLKATYSIARLVSFREQSMMYDFYFAFAFSFAFAFAFVVRGGNISP